MHELLLGVAAALSLTATLAQAAGLRFIDVPADPEGPGLTGAVWSPCAAPARLVMLGDVPVPGVMDCPIAGDKLPFVVFSHGRRGSLRGHHDTAETVADAGFIVAAINHPGDNASDVSQTDDLRARPEIIESTSDRVNMEFTTIFSYHIWWL
jgi:predicted dienelactone hydrolase